MKIALISCSKLKADHPCPARELYAPSQLFSLSCQYAKRNTDAVYILSAEYGLLAESDVIAPYDLTLSRLPEHRQRDWAGHVLAQWYIPPPAVKALPFRSATSWRAGLSE